MKKNTNCNTSANGVLLAGKASEEVTGSIYPVYFNNHLILLECGLWQSSKLNTAYQVNTEKFPFNPREVDYIFLGHAHIDHSGLIPRLYKEGCRARIIMTEDTSRIVKELWYNSSYILNKESARLSKQTGRVYEPVYTKEDVDMALSFTDYYNEFDKIYILDQDIRFQWLKNGHCLGASQLQLILGINGNTKKLLYTSDMGAIKPVNHFVPGTEIPDFYNDIVIMETTYGASSRRIKKRRYSEKKQIKGIIDKTISEHGTVVFPAFAFAKMQELIINLWEIYKDEPSFKTKVYVDTMLGTDISRQYSNILEGDDLETWREVMKWDNLEFIRDYEDSKAIVNNDHSKIVLSASGFGTNGRVVEHIKSIIKDIHNTIILTGYTGCDDTYLAHRLWEHQDEKKIKIDGKEYPYRANIYKMETFSSHMDFTDLVKYGGSVRTNNLVLIHGDMDGKIELRGYLTEERSRNNLTGNIVTGERGLFIKF